VNYYTDTFFLVVILICWSMKHIWPSRQYLEEENHRNSSSSSKRILTTTTNSATLKLLLGLELTLFVLKASSASAQWNITTISPLKFDFVLLINFDMLLFLETLSHPRKELIALNCNNLEVPPWNSNWNL